MSIQEPDTFVEGDRGENPDRDPPPDPDKQKYGEPGSLPEGVPSVKYSFEIPPPPIPASDIKEIVNAEIVVVGGGLAGTTAALSAAEAGANTILVETTARCQGRGGDFGVLGSRLQKKLGIEIDGNEVCLELMKYAANKPDQRLLRLWADRSGEIMNWLMDMTEAAGMESSIFQFPPPDVYNPADNYYPQYQATHNFHGGTAIKCLAENARSKGVKFYLKTRALQLLRKDKDRVTDVIAQKETGEYIRFNAAKAVIICTGDYANNPEMMAKYCPQAAYLRSFLKTSNGDGHLMAMRAGAVMEQGPHAPISHGFAGPLGSNAFLQVNIKGERFQNEDVPGQSYTNQVERQPGHTAWQVYDSKYPDEVKYMGIGLGNVFDLNYKDTRYLKDPDIIADTIEVLAKEMNVPVETFKATIDRYNELARLGKDLDFGKRPDRLTTIEKPPFYAGKGRYALLIVVGGIIVNPKLQALDKEWEVIPGLYLAGSTVGNRFAVDYPTMVPGISNGMALTFGRLAGLNAANLEP